MSPVPRVPFSLRNFEGVKKPLTPIFGKLYLSLKKTLIPIFGKLYLPLKKPCVIKNMSGLHHST